MQRFTVVIEPSGLSYEASSEMALLKSARDAGLVMPSSCRNGTCRTCMCRLMSGSVKYLVDWPGLSADEKAEGFILPCVAVPQSALIIESNRVLDLRDVDR